MINKEIPIQSQFSQLFCKNRANPYVPRAGAWGDFFPIRSQSLPFYRNNGKYSKITLATESRFCYIEYIEAKYTKRANKMKKLLLAIILSAASFAVPAATQAEIENCASIETLASNVMAVRQDGVIPLSSLIKAAGGNELIEFIVLSAFEKPRYNSMKAKAKAINDFAASFATACYRSTLNQEA